MLKIDSVRPGNLQNEHVLIVVERDCNAADFVLIDSVFRPGEKTLKKPRHEFHFPPLELKKGEGIALWSGIGRAHLKVLANGPSQHNLFWRLDKAIWDDASHMPVICSAASFKHVWLPGLQ
jgi:hypothetical protein